MGRMLDQIRETNSRLANLEGEDFLTNNPVDSNLDFDKASETNNAELTLRLKIFFEPVKTTDANDCRIVRVGTTDMKEGECHVRTESNGEHAYLDGEGQ